MPSPNQLYDFLNRKTTLNMKSILIPTDFSLCAQNAENAGMQLAKKFGAEVYLFHHVDLPKNWESLSVSEREGHPNALKKIYEVEASFERIRMLFPDIIIETHITGGDWIDRLRQFVEQKNIDLIVMGSHGTSGKNEFFIGSNTQKVVRRVHCPILVIKEPLKKVAFNKVIYASSFNLTEKVAFLKFKDFIKPFLPEIHLVTIHNSEFLDGPLILQNEVLKDYAELSKPFTAHTHIVEHFTIDGGIRLLAENIGADLVVVSNHYKRPLKRMLVGSNVEALVNHANMPVLTIDFPEEG